MAIYLNAGGHGLPSRATIACQLAHLNAAMRDGTHVAAAAAGTAIAEVRDSAARLMGIRPGQVALGTTTSQFWRAVLARLPIARRRLLIAPHEWGTHLRHLQRMAPDLGVRLDIVPEGEAMDPSAWAARIDDDLAAIMLPHVTSAQGLIYPVTEIGALSRPETVLVVVDAAQSVGRLPVQLPALNCDVLVATARKWLRGPRSTAMLGLSSRAEAVLGKAAAFEPVDFNIALRLGMGAALEQAMDSGIPAVAADLLAIAATFRDRLGRHAELADWIGEGKPAGPVAPGHVTLSIPSSRCAAVDARLAGAGIVAKWARPGEEEPLSLLSGNRGRMTLRITPHRYNTADDAEALAAALAD